MESQIPNKEAMDEWYDHPVTAYFLGVLEARQEYCIDQRNNAFTPGNPNATQEILCRSNGALDELIDIHQDITESQIENLMPDEDEGETGNE